MDESRQHLPYGVLVMEFLPGRSLVYETDLTSAAQCLADIHSTPLPEEHHLLRPENPLAAMLAECREMAAVYLSWPQADPMVKEQIACLLDRAEHLVPKQAEPGGHIINTELNSGNFLMGGDEKGGYLIDWEKPIVGQVEQDLGHFLAPTTTFWKTDTILTREQMADFLTQYKKAVDGRFDLTDLEKRFDRYLVMTCLRGITWCAMAYVEYSTPGRALRNEFTFRKIKAYLEEDFLNRIQREYYDGI